MSDRETTEKKKMTPKERKLKNAIAKSSILQQNPSSNPLSAFCILPPNMNFDVQHDDEHVLLLLRQHPIVNLGWVLLTLIMFVLPFALPFIPSFLFLPATFRTVLLVAWYVVTLGYAVERFVMWYYNIYIVTDERLIDMDFYSLLFKRVSETKLPHVEDITAASGGVIQSFFDYGDVLIQTAAEIPEIEFERVPHPTQVTKLISELIDKEDEEIHKKR
jgi:hypothetical protein